MPEASLVPRAHVSFGQHQDMELWKNPERIPEPKILGVLVSWRMRALVYMPSKFVFERTAVSNFESKRHMGFGNEIVDYSRAPCLGADQKTCGLRKRDCEAPSGLILLFRFFSISFRLSSSFNKLIHVGVKHCFSQLCFKVLLGYFEITRNVSGT